MPKHTQKSISSLTIGVVGAGSWGTALANLLATKGYPIDLWVFETEVKEHIENNHENNVFLPGFPLSDNIVPTNDIKTAVAGKDIVLVVVPSHVMRETAGLMAEHLSKDTLIISASKGIENKTHMTMLGVLKDVLDPIDQDKLIVLSGPSFAKEVVQQMPTVVAVASTSAKNAKLVQHVFATPRFRVYTNDDPVGVEVGGAIKNVIAIAAGISDGLGLGLNARAALITRGLTEMKRLGACFGTDPHTFAGLAGVGDLMLTCTGNLSRNHTVGVQLGEGKTLDEILLEMRMVAEGVKTTRSVYNLSQNLGIELPICNEVYKILFENQDPKKSIKRLMTRTLKHELD
ncbi:MAG: NAD(P)H-dependent glycerol-3-phosphate dehydrogenase [Proteobacteria bacterium]|nr:NAD(P)H-dependent glycerol-3-phosphate dehydrogenase [Pseudomonadota bacterium]